MTDVRSLLIIRPSAGTQWQKAAMFDTPLQAMRAIPEAVWERIMPDKDVYISGIVFPRYAILSVVNGRETGLGYISSWESLTPTV